jgi:outer membrane lipoprotein SlyB
VKKAREWNHFTAGRELAATLTALAFVVLFVAASGSARAQAAPAAAPTQQTPPRQTPPQQAAAAWSPAQNIGMFAFPKNGQSSDQQLKDESECYGMAKQRTGIDAQAPPPQGLSEEEKKAAQQQAADNAKEVQGTRVRGAARGAAGGAAIGAIAGNAGKGAAAGAVAGTMRGGMAQRSANAQSKQQAAAQTAAAEKKAEEEMLRQHQEGMDTFQRAFAACMDARNYSVK